MEIWKDIQGYEGKYQVSNLGRVKSLGNDKTKKEKILKRIKDKYGYLIVNLCKERKKKHILVHRLVAETFIPNHHNYPIINHKDENTNYKEVSRKRTEKISKTVLQYTKDGEFVREWSSTNECGRNGFDQGAVAACCRGKLKSHKGFIWRYKNGES